MASLHRIFTRALALAAVATVALGSASSAWADEWTDSDIAGLKETVLQVNGESWMVRDSRSGSPTVLLVHGMPDDGFIWRQQVPVLLAAGYRVIVPDTLGNGKSAKPADRALFKSNLLVAGLASVLDQLGVDKFHFVGHDVGAVMGWEFVMTYPERALSHVALSVGHPSAWAEQSFTLDGARMNWYSMLNQAPNNGDVWRAGNGRLLRMGLDSHPDKDRVIEYLLKPGAVEYGFMFDTVNSITQFMVDYASGAYENLPRISVPTLGIVGGKDVAMWVSQMTGSAAYMDAEWKVAVFPEAGHWPMLDHPDEINAALVTWLAAH